ncbi:hypothetical protein OIU77_005829 [Salix suchowensis]|uniref:Uncharacterized protein n=1 Tax=Salix suchowensis TaxID=1278906 RepID=A0ABQ9AS03_9ROSI|nr:hypothetical protein OIU77_005829 [Salix suchowensis]
MDITHDVRTCAAYLNYDCVPNGAFLGVNGEALLFQMKIREKFYRMSSDNATEARTPDEVGVQNENIKAAETSQTESTSYSVAAMAKRSSSLKVQPGKPGRAHQLIPELQILCKSC